MGAETTISLREWIKCAQECSKSSVSISGGCDRRCSISWDYLLASLKIAISLSDEIKNAEDLACVGLLEGLNILPQQNSNGSIPDWAEFASVRLQDGRDGAGNEEQCGRSNIPIERFLYSISTGRGKDSMSGIDPCELQTLPVDFLDHIDESLATPFVGTESGAVDKLEHNQDERHYLNIHYAYIADTGEGSDECSQVLCSDSFRDKQQRIYLLGLVFYELFSGGERPPPELLISPSSLVVSSLDFDSSRGLQVLHDIVVDEESDIFSDPIDRTYVLGCEGRLTGDLGESCSSFEIRKRRSTLHHSLRCSEHTQGEMKKGESFCKATTRVLIEQLNLKGIPLSLCSMIYNMIDCINRDFRGEESYSNISDVMSDLHLMIERPQRFLRDWDATTRSLTPLTLNETVFVRNEEFESLKCVYRRFVSGSPEIALIAGESRTGKTWLANRIGRFIVCNGGVFLQGKFDRLHRTQPLSVLATAFNAYCDMLIQDTNRERSKFIVSKLQEALGRDACQLVKVIPTLNEIIFCEETNDDANTNQNYMGADKRLYYLMCRFVETISRFSECSIALFLDDVQWADGAFPSVPYLSI